MTFPGLNTVNASQDVSELLIYVNDLTDGLAMPLVLIAFFLVAFLGNFFLQLRFRGTGRIDFSFAVAGFVTFGLAVLMSLKNGLLAPQYLFISLAVAILGAFILYLTRES